VKIEPKTSWEPIWNHTKNQTSLYHETIVPNPHAKNNDFFLTWKALRGTVSAATKGFF
jgi:hypothetical protein